VDVGSLGFRVQGQVLGMEFHASTSITARVAMAANFVWGGHSCPPPLLLGLI
jgi:hypothetical protein